MFNTIDRIVYNGVRDEILPMFVKIVGFGVNHSRTEEVCGEKGIVSHSLKVGQDHKEFNSSISARTETVCIFGDRGLRRHSATSAVPWI